VRFLGVLKADEASEAGVPPGPGLMDRCVAFVEEITRAGVLLATDGLHPSAKAVRVRVADGKARVTDGPFAETNELIASYALLEVKSKAEAVEWTTRFLKVLGGGECTVYQVYDPTDCPPAVR
jgi:hypothetical protein